ncbi:MAG TPA: ArgR family transcriptional regulator [Terriglobales bacterium]|jgi:transcriptional regulator of arginine metabolism
MSPKPLRQKVILELLDERPITSQEDLQRALKKRGFVVGQATLSRDIRELGLVKASGGYELPSGDLQLDPALPPASRLVREFVLDVRPAQNLLVIKTAIGSAQPVAAALDIEAWPEVVGSIAGDDTILIVCPEHKSAMKLAARIEEMTA